MRNGGRVRSAALVLTVIALSRSEARADGITYEASATAYVQTIAGSAFDYDSGPSVQASGSRDTTDGVATASTVWTLSPGDIDVTFDHVTGASGSLCISQGLLRFHVDSAHPFAASAEYAFGAFDAGGTVTGGGYLFASLFDYTTSTYVFSNYQYSSASSGSAFTLGETAGNSDNYLEGSLVGVLEPGHSYGLGFTVFVADESGFGGPLAGEGGLRLVLDPPEEPVDTDADGLTDTEEAALGSDPLVADTDADGLTDGAEVSLAAGSGCPDLLVADSDGDSLLDGDELTLGTSLCDADTDGDGSPDDVDPSPLDPSIPTTDPVEQADEIAEELAALPVALVNAPNAKSAEGRLDSLARRMESVAAAIADGDRATAIGLLASIRSRLDGDSKQEDWLLDSATKSGLLAELDALADLLD